jgi:hypothetical protein
MTDWINLIGGGFAHMSAPFAVHPYDRDRARRYRKSVRAAGLGWATVQSHFDAYANEEGWGAAKRAEELERVRKFMGKLPA